MTKTDYFIKESLILSVAKHFPGVLDVVGLSTYHSGWVVNFSDSTVILDYVLHESIPFISL